MIRHIVYSFIFIFCVGSISAHEIDNISLTEIVKENNEIHVKMKISTEYLTHTTLAMNPELGFNDYVKKPFDSNIIVPVKKYANNSFSIAINKDQLIPYLFAMEWLKNTIFSHNAMIVRTIKYKLIDNNPIQYITIKNALILRTLPDQKNIVNVSTAENEHTKGTYTTKDLKNNTIFKVLSIK
ncbi:DUF6702 family protein [uncultured Cytophaga sp.]|uniref:DUF6702 family protein n=1 Tax=uncultured Cytophaga sp. TaxID=160238 RepID=UPI00261F8EF4|nr:DUF6702 family protein [uncultured Cytophaga sp.]